MAPRPPLALVAPQHVVAATSGGDGPGSRRIRWKVFVDAIQKHLAAWNLHAIDGTEEVTDGSGRFVILVFMDFEQLCVEAEHEGLMKPLKDEVQDPDSLQFDDDRGKRVALSEFRANVATSFAGYTDALHDGDQDAFFEPWEVLLLTKRRLDRVAASCHVVKEPRPHEPLLQALLREQCIERIVPLHTGALKHLNITGPISVKGLNEIHAVFGDGVAAYFVFMRSFTLWLLPLGIASLWLKVFRPQGVNVDTSTKVPFYELFVVLWAAAFPSILDRADAHFACSWGRLDAVGHESARPEYYGELVASPITGEMERHYPVWKRWLKYVVSAIVTAAMLSIAFGFMILSLNLQGCIHDPMSNRARGLEVTVGSFFLVESIAQFARPGAVFDPTGAGDPFFGGFISFVPVVVHAIVISVLNKVYRLVANVLTEWENHRTDQDANNALIIKRFLFEAFDCYIALFYIAFYERDVRNLRSELISLYHCDCFRRLLLESLVPLLRQQGTHAVRSRVNAFYKKTDNIDTGVVPRPRSSVEVQIEQDEQEEFDDYLEMVIQFGYVTLFAGVFPIASFLSIICNCIEVFSDAFKLKITCQRPMAYAASGMPRNWHFIITCMCWASIITNVLTFVYVSEQAKHLLPGGKFIEDAPGVDDHFVNTSGVWFAFFLENALLAVSAAISCLPRQPEWVRIARLGRRYRQAKFARDALQAGRTPDLRVNAKAS